jgi:DivIVA domain-containing protein
MTDRLPRPEFATSMRGYDRLQVDDYIDRVHDIVAESQERARVAESELEFSRHTTVGPRVAQILDLAVEEGKELRERVQAEVDRLRADAQAEAEAIMADARDSAELTRAEAERTRQEVLADADARRQEVLDEVERLALSKAQLLSDLSRLQRILAQATRAEHGPGDASIVAKPVEETAALVASGAAASNGGDAGEVTPEA